MSAQIQTERFHELEKHYDTQAGVVGEFGNEQAARAAFARAMRQRGYRPGKNGIWLKDGNAVVMVS